MPERHKDCGSKRLKIFVSKMAQYVPIYCVLRQNNPLYFKDSIRSTPQSSPEWEAHQRRTQPASWPLSNANSLGKRLRANKTNFPNKL